MEDAKKPKDGCGSTAPSTNAKDGRFVPLKLILQPTGMSVELTKCETVVGRHLGVDLRLPLPDVSRRHCQFVFAERCWHVYDLDSLNGVFVNQKRVKHALLHHGDVIRLGGFTFQIEIQSSGATLPLPTTGPSERGVRSLADILQTQPQVDEGKRQAS